jgi:deoxyinosine 3'endonuclease (endonuclease V)
MLAAGRELKTRLSELAPLVTGASPGWPSLTHRRLLAGVSSGGPAGGPYLPTLLALREGLLLEQAVRGLPVVPKVPLVNATGRDPPRRACLALQLGPCRGCPRSG